MLIDFSGAEQNEQFDMDGRASALSKRLLPSMDMKSRHKIHANHL
jgi:hypothetical protein